MQVKVFANLREICGGVTVNVLPVVTVLSTYLIE